MRTFLRLAALGLAVVTTAPMIAGHATAGSSERGGNRVDELAGYWSPARRAEAKPRDLRAPSNAPATPTATGSTVTNSPWTGEGIVQAAAGRIYFEMPLNKRATRWGGYVCSGTVATDGTTNAVSIIITAAHCVYDDANKQFARNVLFIPNQDGTTGAGTDRDCSNDPIGCWAPKFGAVDTRWTKTTWPNNIPYDYAYYVVPTMGAHTQGLAGANDSLEVAAGSLPVNFLTLPTTGVDATALGYSYSDDPNFMYCQEALSTSGTANWWLPNCGLSGGASGGPWLQAGSIVSVNSWGYSNQPGMAGPKLSGTSAKCVFDAANTKSPTGTARGIAVTCP